MTVGDIAALALRTASTFSVMAILWSLWSSDSIPDWIALISVVDVTLENVAFLFLVFLMIAVIFGLTIWISSRSDHGTETKAKQPTSLGSTCDCGRYRTAIPDRQPRDLQSSWRQSSRIDQRSDFQQAQRPGGGASQRGYYEDLIGVNRFNSQLWEIYSKRPVRLKHLRRRKLHVRPVTT